MNRKHHIQAGCLAIAVAMTALLPGCGRSKAPEPENVANSAASDSTSSQPTATSPTPAVPPTPVTPTPQAAPETNPGISPSNTTAPVTRAGAVRPSGGATGRAAPSTIGSGHFNGHREPITFRELPAPALATSLGGTLIVAGTQSSRSDAELRGSGFADESLLAPRVAAGGATLVSLKDARTVLLSEIAAGLPRQRLSRPVQEANPAVVTVLCANKESAFCGTSAGTVEVLRPAPQTAATIPVTRDAVTALAASPRNDLLLAGDSSGSIAWIVPAKSAVQTAPAHSGPILSVAFSPEGGWAATASSDLTVGVWDVASRSLRHTLKGHEHPVGAIAFSPDGEWLVSGDAKGRLIRWRVAAGEKVASYAFRTGLISTRAPTAADLTISPNLDDEEAERAGIHSDDGITAIAISRDQTLLAAGAASGYTQTFDLEHGTELSPIFQGSAVTDVAFADDGSSLLVATRSGNVSRWWRAPDPPRLLTGHQGSVRFAAVDAAGRRAVTGGVDRQLRVWDVEQRSLVRTLDNRGEAIATGALSPDGQRAATSGYGSGITLWNLAEMKPLGKRYGHKKRVWWLDFAPDGAFFASGSDDQTARIWEFSSQKLKHTLEHDAPVHFVRYSPDGTKLVTSTLDPRGWQFPARLRLWNAATGKPLIEFRGHHMTVNSAVFSPDGSELTSCGADGQVCRWKVATGERLSDASRPHGLSHAGLLAQGSLLVMRRFSTGVFIDRAGSLTRMSEFDVPTRSIGDLNVSSQGDRIIAGTDEGAVYVWSLRHD